MCPTRKTIPPLLLALGVASLAVGAFFGGVPGDSRTPAPAAGPAGKAPDPVPVEPVPFPDGVLSPRRTALVSSPKGGIQAIRLEDGKVLWTNEAVKAQPWLAAGRRLVARGERLFVLDLDDNGKLLRKCDPLNFPKVTVPERCTVAFHLWGPRVVGDTLEARWYGVAYIDRRKGRPFPFKAWTAFNKAAPVGTVKVNLATGKVILLQTDKKPADVAAGLVPEASKPERRLPPGLPEKLADVWRSYHKDQNGRITLLGGRLVGVSMTLEKVGPGYLKRIDLNAWDVKTGAAAAPVELVKGNAQDIANIVLTEDRRHAAVRFGTFDLAVYSLADGKRVGKEVKEVVSPEQAFVEGTRLYHALLLGSGFGKRPYVLKALDLATGKVLWERPLKPWSKMPLPP
jgi:hypothetical protein